MRRAVIYARYSSDLQSDRSIEDQIALCREFAKRKGLSVNKEYHDRARSGASIFGRDGLLSLMEDAKSGVFGTVIVEALDRISRDQEDLAAIYKRLSFVDVDIETVHDGRADVVQIGIRGLVGQMFLRDLANKVKRGQAGVVREGRHPGGRAYGYRPRRGYPGELKIIENEAAIVRRIFKEYTAGRSPRAIVHDLNKDGVLAPRGSRWNASTVNGNKARGYGIIQNPLYAGEIVWNRTRMIRNPDTGKRISRVNPQNEWIRADAPELAIVDKKVWQAAAQRKASQTHNRLAGRTPRKPYLLKGIVRCGTCGGGMSIADRRKDRVRIHCSASREAGTCKTTRKVSLNDIETAAIRGVKDCLGDPAYLAEYLKAYNEERRHLAADAGRQQSRAESRLARAEAALSRLVDALADGRMPLDIVTEKVAALEIERDAAKSDLASIAERAIVISLHPATVQQYKLDIDTLAERIMETSIEGSPDATTAFRRLVAAVYVHHAELPVTIDVQGRLSEVTGTPIAPSDSNLGVLSGSGRGT